jgi:hypothetical protein
VATSKTGIKHKVLSISEKLNVIKCRAFPITSKKLLKNSTFL